MKNKPLFSIGMRDAFKGFILSVLAVVLSTLYKSLDAGSFPATWQDWKVILLTGIGSGIAYLLKNFFTNSDDRVLRKEIEKDPYR